VRAILSVWDKTGLVDFARGLTALGWEIYSSGRTQQTLEEAGVPAGSVSEITGFPEILDGRVKTLHPRLHGGILARRDLPEHRQQLAEHGIVPVDLVVTNLYPFVETVSQSPIPFGVLAADGDAQHPPEQVQAAIEQIDIGGPALVRASAKNFEHVVVLTDPADYQPVLAALQAGGVSLSMRAQLAQKAFEHTARYDAYVAQYFAAANGVEFADAVSLPLSKAGSLSYGENPHQQGAFYRLADPRLAGPSLADMEQLGGAALSYNNLLDLDSAYAIVAEFDEPAVAIVKHNSPCGVATAPSLVEAYRKAYAGDPLSAFGGVIACNRPVDEATAQARRGTLFWALVAPEYTGGALDVLRRYKSQLRYFRAPVPPRVSPGNALPGFRLHYRPVLGGFLAQTRDAVPISEITFTTVSHRPPSAQELADLRFAWRVVKHVRSNATVFVRDGALLAAGAGQMSRVDSVAAATHVARRSENRTPDSTDERPAAGCVMATDGFFAKPDAVEAAVAAGVTAIAHPGGGKEDAEAAAVADRAGIAMVVTGIRHFRH
jgi:phosphoribosylaminoimidazolecarboxamide formyltransferase / IMP cyclohydrolase